MKNFILVFFVFFITKVFSQATITIEDYNRAVSYLWQNLNDKRVFNLRVMPSWFSDSAGVWYTTQEKNYKFFNKIEFSAMTIEPLFDQEKLAQILTDSLNKEISAGDLPITNINYIDNQHLEFSLIGKRYLLDLTNYTLTEKEESPRNLLESKSPDGKWIAYVNDYNLFIKSTENGEVKQLSTAGKKNYEYASYYGWGDIITGEGGERPERFSVNWSPDSKYLQTYICDLRSADKMYLLDWSVDTLYRPRLLSYYRGSPGDTAMVYMIPVLYEVSSGKEIKTNLPRNTHINQVNFRWSEKPGIVYASYSERGFKRIHLLQMDLNNSNLTEIYAEESETNIDNFSYFLAEKTGKIIITSERSGWKQLYVLDLKTKELMSITNGDYYIDDVEFINEEEGWLLFLASGKQAGINPYFQQLYKISLNGKGLKNMTADDLHHEISISRDGNYFFDNISSVNKATRTVLRDTKSGKLLKEISSADIEEIVKENWQFPEIFSVTARDGKTTIYGAMWKPVNFDPAKKYPVIDQTYTGPHTNMFPRSFARGLTISNQALAELGFIVVTVDGLGSAGRSKEFHNYSYKNMGKNLTDHVIAIKELGRRYSWIDTDKVGIFGHSAGGFDAGHAVLEFPDFYKVAVASSADHDFRMEKAWWPEMYMGWPVDSTYHEVSNITMAANLKGKLLITHGGIDENVNPSATFKLAEALVKANKEFDMLIFPSQRHGYSGDYGRYFTRKKWNYFVEHLLGARPIWDFEME
ncbi:MAG TPA: prolyl oligopeptidase family serine peptidase [Cyclobacteriaceae bacterium]